MSIKIKNTQVTGWEAAIRGARNPMNSWEKSDSQFICPDEGTNRWCGEPDIGPNDHKLVMNLCKGGTEEAHWPHIGSGWVEKNTALDEVKWEAYP